MQQRDGTTLFSATDLVAYLECEHLTVLDFQALGDADMRAGKSMPDESAELIARKGNEHEWAYLQRLRAQGRAVVDIAAGGGNIDEKMARTLQAMHQGAEVIYQATLRDGPLIGHADFLRRVDGEPSALGSWRYEVADTKLARSAKAKFLVQLAFYSALLAKAQGAEPMLMHVVLGDQTERAFRCADYMHYYRSLLGRFTARVQALADGAQAGTIRCRWRTATCAIGASAARRCASRTTTCARWPTPRPNGGGTFPSHR